MRPERRLHIGGRTLHIAQHQDAAPLGDRDAHRELPHGEGDRLLMLRNGRLHLVDGFLRLLVIASPAVTHGGHNLILAKHLVRFQQFFQRADACHAVQIPHGMGQLLPQLRRGKGILLLGRQGVKKFFDLLLVDETALLIGGEKFVQVKGVVHCPLLLGEVQSLLNALPDHAGELIGKHGQPGQGLIGVFVLAIPAFFCLLLIRVGPVENLLFGELLAGQGLKRRTR